MKLNLTPIKRNLLLEQMARAIAKQNGIVIPEAKNETEFFEIMDRNPTLGSYLTTAEVALMWHPGCSPESFKVL